MFEKNGYTCIFKPNFSFLATWHTSILIKSIAQVRFSFKVPKDAALYLRDHDNNDARFKTISPDYFIKEVADKYHIPMPMVNTFYVFDLDKESEKVNRNENREIKILFSGNIDPVHYKREENTKYFNLATRIEIINWINNLKIKGITYPKGSEFWDDLSQNYDLVLSDRKKSNIPPPKLPETLSKSAFFLALPGVVMPLCHNIVEAMSCGSIPILNYKDLMQPALEDEVNCLVFHTQEDFEKVINKALAMSEEEINGMRNNVILYYETHLKKTSVVENLLSTKKETILLVAEYHSLPKT